MPCRSAEASRSKRIHRRWSARLQPSVLIFVIVVSTTFAQTPRPVAPVFGVLGVPEEVAPIEQRLSEPRPERIGGTHVTSGLLDGTPVVVARSGIGKVNAAMAATILIDRFSPIGVVFSGTAGALDPELGPGDIVIGVRVAQHDVGRLTESGFMRRPTRNSVTGEPNPVFFEAPDGLLAAARAATADVTLGAVQTARGTRQPRVREGVIVTGDVFVAERTRRDDLRAFGAQAVEMEGAAMVQVCRQFSTPCLVIRGITDSADGSAQADYQTNMRTASENAAKLTTATIARFAAARR